MADTLKDKISQIVLKSLRDKSEKEPETYWSADMLWVWLNNEDLGKEELYEYLLAHSEDEKCNVKDFLDSSGKHMYSA